MSIPRIFETPRFVKTIPWIAFSFVLLIYLAFPTKNYYWDGIEFATVIEEAGSLNASLLHPNHLFYNVAGYIAYQAARFFDPSIRAISVLQILNSFFGVLSSVVLFFILKKLFNQNYLSLALSLLFAFSATWWKFSTDADSYIPSVLFLLISFYFILPDQKPRPLIVALTHSLAMCFHQLALFFFPVAILGIFLQTATFQTRKRIILVLQYAFGAFLLTFGTFSVSFYLRTGRFDLKEFLGWVTWFSSENGFLFNAVRSAFLTLRGTTRLFFDGRFSFLDYKISTLVLLASLTVSLAAFFYKLARSSGLFKGLGKTITDKTFYRHPVVLLCAVWIAVYLLFLFFFIPGNTFYRLFYLPPLIVIFGLLISKGVSSEGQVRNWHLALLVSIVCLSNFLLFIRPYSQLRKDTPLAVAMEMNRKWTDKTVVFYDSFNSDNRLVKYFNPTTRWIQFNSVNKLETETRKVYLNGGTVWLETTLVEKLKLSNPSNQQLSENLVEKERLELINKSYYLKFIQIAPRDLENRQL
jgi:hypothetical protein